MSLTGIKAANGATQTIHVGHDDGSFDSVPLCPALRTRETETTDDLANCPACKKIVREQYPYEGAESLFATWRHLRDDA